MPRTIQCVYSKKEAEGLVFAPFRGAGKAHLRLGEQGRVAAWMKHQTMLVNENRLNLADQRAHRIPGARDGEFLLRRRRRAARGLCSAAGLNIL